MINLDAEALQGELSKPEAVIGPTTFSFRKLPSMAAWRLMEEIRVAVAGRLSSMTAEDALEPGVEIIKAVIGQPPEVVDSIRKQIFQVVYFQNGAAVTPQVLVGAEDMAFDGLEPVAVYEVLVRGLAVNFTASFAAVASRLQG